METEVVSKVETIPPKKRRGGLEISSTVRKMFSDFLDSNEEVLTVRIKDRGKTGLTSILGGVLKACWMEMSSHNPKVADLTRVETVAGDIYLEFKKRV